MAKFSRNRNNAKRNSKRRNRSRKGGMGECIGVGPPSWSCVKSRMKGKVEKAVEAAGGDVYTAENRLKDQLEREYFKESKTMSGVTWNGKENGIQKEKWPGEYSRAFWAAAEKLGLQKDDVKHTPTKQLTPAQVDASDRYNRGVVDALFGGARKRKQRNSRRNRRGGKRTNKNRKNRNNRNKKTRRQRRR